MMKSIKDIREILLGEKNKMFKHFVELTILIFTFNLLIIFPVNKERLLYIIIILLILRIYLFIVYIIKDTDHKEFKNLNEIEQQELKIWIDRLELFEIKINIYFYFLNKLILFSYWNIRWINFYFDNYKVVKYVNFYFWKILILFFSRIGYIVYDIVSIVYKYSYIEIIFFRIGFLMFLWIISFIFELNFFNIILNTIVLMLFLIYIFLPKFFKNYIIENKIDRKLRKERLNNNTFHKELFIQAEKEIFISHIYSYYYDMENGRDYTILRNIKLMLLRIRFQVNSNRFIEYVGRDKDYMMVCYIMLNVYNKNNFLKEKKNGSYYFLYDKILFDFTWDFSYFVDILEIFWMLKKEGDFSNINIENCIKQGYTIEEIKYMQRKIEKKYNEFIINFKKKIFFILDTEDFYNGQVKVYINKKYERFAIESDFNEENFLKETKSQNFKDYNIFEMNNAINDRIRFNEYFYEFDKLSEKFEELGDCKQLIFKRKYWWHNDEEKMNKEIEELFLKYKKEWQNDKIIKINNK